MTIHESSKERFELLDRVWNRHNPDRNFTLNRAKQFADIIPADLSDVMITGETDSIVFGWVNVARQTAATVTFILGHAFELDEELMLQVSEKRAGGHVGIAAAMVSPVSFPPVAVALVKYVLGEVSENS